MILDTVILTFLGMGMVFIFLFVMIAAMNALRALLPLLARLSPEAAPAKAAGPRPAAALAAAVALAHFSSGRHK